jgi:Domain of unknown function (DUF4112)
MQGETKKKQKKLRHLAWLLDSSIPIPGTHFKVGIDALIGLLPGIGDAIGVMISSYLLREAVLLGAPKVALIRMGINVVIEAVIGMIPLVGDVFDAVFKANQRNVRLLDEYLADPVRTTRVSGVFVGLLGLLSLVLLAGTTALGYMVLSWVWDALRNAL